MVGWGVFLAGGSGGRLRVGECCPSTSGGDGVIRRGGHIFDQKRPYDVI